MPGLVGAMDTHHPEAVSRLICRMSAVMRHEDWYSVQNFVDEKEGIALGRVSLGIFNRRPQPAFDQTRSIAAMLDGELTNRASLDAELERGNDPEADDDATRAIRAYRQWGEGFARHLEGSFTAAIWDRRTKTLTVANDRFGLRPLFYGQTASRLLFASEGKAIIADPEFPRQIDMLGMADLFYYGYLLNGKTLLKDISLLPPASVLTFREGGLHIDRYWFPTSYLEDPRSRQKMKSFDYLEDLRFRFNDAVRKRLVGGSRMGVFLTGGLDSRAILSAVEEPESIQCLTFYGVPDAHDRIVAKAIAQIARQPHHEHDFGSAIMRDYAEETTKVGEGMLSLAQCHGLAPIRWAAELSEVILSGWGGELMRGGGYAGRFCRGIPRFPVEWNDHDGMLREYRHKENRMFSPEQQERLFTPSYWSLLRGQAEASFYQATKVTQEFPSAWNRIEYFYIWDRSPRQNTYGLLFMNRRLEHRTPYADYDLVEAYTRLPFSLQSAAPSSVVHRHIIKHNNPELARIMDYNTGLPVDANRWRIAATTKLSQMLSRRPLSRLRVPIYRAKYYVDHDQWIRDHLADFVRDTLLDQRTIARGYFSQAGLEEIIDSHLSGKAQMAEQIGTLMAFELWHRLFLD